MLSLERMRPLEGLVLRNGRLWVDFFAQHHVDAMDLSLSTVLWMLHPFPGETDKDYRRHLGCFGITGSLELRKMEPPSGGQSRCLSRPHIFILDEPSNHLDALAK